MTGDLGHARLIDRPTVHVVRSVDRGREGPLIASLCGRAAAPLDQWAENTWTTLDGRTGPCAVCDRLAARRRKATS